MSHKSNGKFLKMFAWKEDRPDAEEESTEPTLKRYFKLLGRKFWKLISLNMMMLPMILPLVGLAALYFGFERTPTATDAAFPALYGASLIEPTPFLTALLDLFGLQLQIPVYGTSTYLWMGLCVLFLIVTWGWQNVGATYVLRGLVRGDAVFVWSDYFYAVKRNLKQGFFLGLIDLLVLFLAVFDFLYFNGSPDTFTNNVMFFGVVALSILYFFMRFYIYLLSVTFHLSIRKIFKNAIIFVTLGIKRNLMGALGIVVMTAINVVLFRLLMPLNIAIPLILPFLYYLSFTAFTSAYAAYPIIDRYMIAPYAGKQEEEETAEEEGEAPELPENE